MPDTGGGGMNRVIHVVRVCFSGLVGRSWPEGFCLGLLRRVGKNARKMAQRKLPRVSGSEFVNRSKQSSKLVVVLVGYKPELWPLTLKRIACFVPADFDVCLASSGRRVEALDDLAEQNGWSYLSTRLNEVSIVQNIAIEKHPAAQYIFKLDEDIFIGRGYFDAMLKGHLAVSQAGRHKPGISAPLINVNGYGYVEFLRELGLCKDYLDRFGELRQAADKIHAHYDGEAALWLWKRSLPFDEMVRRFANLEFKYSACPHRFNIGAILFERSFWLAMGGLAINDHPGVLGYDEEQVCKYCLNSSEVITVLHNVFAGHFGFGPQNQMMMGALNDLIPGLTIESDKVVTS